MSLTLQMLINNGLLDELAGRFSKENDTKILLAAAGFPAARRPNFDRAPDAQSYWFDVCEKIEGGVSPGNLEALLARAGRLLPGNPIFLPFVVAGSPASSPPAAQAQVDGSTSYVPRLVAQYDAFLSFSSADRTVVRGLYDELKQDGVTPWMDEWDIPLGSPFLKELEGILEKVKAVVAFFGTGGLGPWQCAEIQAVMDRQVRGQCLVVPVLLPGVSGPEVLPPFLRRLNAARLVGGPGDRAVVERLAKEIRDCPP